MWCGGCGDDDTGWGWVFASVLLLSLSIYGPLVLFSDHYVGVNISCVMLYNGIIRTAACVMFP